eukprot:5815451-Lingulodinium_polyedra.AAC.1
MLAERLPRKPNAPRLRHRTNRVGPVSSNAPACARDNYHGGNDAPGFRIHRQASKGLGMREVQRWTQADVPASGTGA